MRREIRNHWSNAWLLALAVTACGTELPDVTTIGGLSREEYEAAQDSKEAAAVLLASGEYKEAIDHYAALKEKKGFECEGEYGLMLARSQKLFADVNTLIRPVIILGGRAPAFVEPNASGIDVQNIIENVVKVLEQNFVSISSNARGVIEKDCKLDTPGGVPLTIGDPEYALYFRIVFGFEWDSTQARLALAAMDSIQATFDYILAHNILWNDDLADVLDSVQTLNSDQEAEERQSQATENPKRYSGIGPVRMAGAAFDLVPELLDWKDAMRRDRIDNELAEAFKVIYSTESGKEQGIAPDLVRHGVRLDENAEDPFAEAARKVIGFVDADRDGKISVDDSFIIGIRGLDMTGYFSMPDNQGGFRVKIPQRLGNVAGAIDEANKIVDNLGQQLGAVDDPGVSTERLTVAPFNNIIAYIQPLNENVRPLPSVLELDARAFFTQFKPVRDLLPYWYDHDSDPATFDEFIIEAESSIPYDDGVRSYDSSPLVAQSDLAHFPPEIAFDTALQPLLSPNVQNLTIPADGETPAASITFPVPYIAWQSPSFNDAIYVDLSDISLTGVAESMHPATNAEINTLTLWFLNYYLADQVDILGD